MFGQRRVVPEEKNSCVIIRYMYITSYYIILRSKTGLTAKLVLNKEIICTVLYFQFLVKESTILVWK